MTEKLNSPPFQPNCEVMVKNVSKVNSRVTMEQGLVANFGINNTNDKNVTVKIKISSEDALCFEG